MYRFFYYILSFVSLTFFSCGQDEKKEILIYDGPARIAENIETYYTENDRVKVKMRAKKVFEFLNGDSEFPEGIYLEFYDETGRLTTILKANHAYFFKEENQWRGRDNVEIKNIEKNEQLNTEELFWKPAEEKIYTDKFVTIRQQGDVIYGEGLDAKQDLTYYKILKPTGEIEIEE